MRMRKRKTEVTLRAEVKNDMKILDLEVGMVEKRNEWRKIIHVDYG